MTNRVCSKCHSDNTRIEYRKHKDGSLGKPHHLWLKDSGGGWLCFSCYYKRRDHNKVLFKGRQRRMKESPRVGVCNWCRAVVGEINAQIDKLCTLTNMNHLAYHDDNPLKDAIENCVYCHNIYHKEERQNRKKI